MNQATLHHDDAATALDHLEKALAAFRADRLPEASFHLGAAAQGLSHLVTELSRQAQTERGAP